MSAVKHPLLGAAGIVAALTAAVHLAAGQGDVAAPLLAATLAPEPKWTLLVVWHMVSLQLVLAAVALLAGAVRTRGLPRSTALVIGAHFGGSAAVFLLVGAVSGLGAWALPQWVLLLPVAVLCVVATRARAEG